MLRPATLLKRDSDTGIFQRILGNLTHPVASGQDTKY